MTYYLIFLGVMSLFSFVIYGVDKRKAIKHAWRIKEAVLLGVGFFGGAAGALFGMKLFHHKTKHWYFWAVNIIGLLAQIAILIYILLI